MSWIAPTIAHVAPITIILPFLLSCSLSTKKTDTRIVIIPPKNKIALYIVSGFILTPPLYILSYNPYFVNPEERLPQSGGLQPRTLEGRVYRAG